MTSRSNDSSDNLSSIALQKDTILLLLDIVTNCNESVNANQALQSVIDHVCEYAGFAVGHAYLTADDDTYTLRSPGIFNSDSSPTFATFCQRSSTVSFRLGEGMVGRALASKSPIWIADYPAGQFSRSKAAAEAGIVGAWAVPLLRADQPLGVLEFFSLSDAPPEADLEQVLLRAAEQVGCVILRDHRLAAATAEALATEEARRRDAVVYHIDVAIADEHAIGHTLDSITAKIAIELEVDAAHVLLCEFEDTQFELLPTVSPALRSIHFPTERHRSDPARRAAIDGEPVHIDNTHDLEPHEALPAYMSAQGVRSYYAVPLHGDGGLNGILEICGKLPRRRSETWRDTLVALAKQTAVALERYRADTDAEPATVRDLRKAA